MAKKPAFDKPQAIIPAFSVVRTDGGWRFVKLCVDQDWNVLSAEVSQPDMKPIITERFRIEVGKYWGKIDEQPAIKIENS